ATAPLRVRVPRLKPPAPPYSIAHPDVSTPEPIRHDEPAELDRPVPPPPIVRTVSSRTMTGVPVQRIRLEPAPPVTVPWFIVRRPAVTFMTLMIDVGATLKLLT